MINHILYKSSVTAVTISKICQQSFIDLYGIDRVTCITNGREPLKFSGNKPKEVGLLRRSPVFIHVARHAPQKNQARLFKAFEKLYEEGVNFELMCIGSHYDEYLEKYKNHPQIHIFGEKRNVGDYMASADYFILSSDFEGLPLTLLEAMSMGVTPISTPAGGVADVIRDGENGYMTKGFDDEEFYQKVKQAIAEKGRFSREAIQQDYEDKYSMKVCANKYYEIYKSLLK